VKRGARGRDVCLSLAALADMVQTVDFVTLDGDSLPSVAYMVECTLKDLAAVNSFDLALADAPLPAGTPLIFPARDKAQRAAPINNADFGI